MSEGGKTAWGSCGNVFVDLSLPNAKELLELAERAIARRQSFEDFQNASSRLGFDLKAETFKDGGKIQ